MVNAVPSPWSIEPFHRQTHDRAGFDCGVPELNEWLATKASQFEKKDLARIYVLVETGQTTVKGYYALSNHTVAYEVMPPDQAKGLPRIDLPVVLIGKLAVDRSVQGQRLGELLLMDALCRAYPMCCVSLTIDPGVNGQAFILRTGILPQSLGRIAQRKDTTMALTQGGEGSCRFMFITDQHDTLLGQELYIEGGYCVKGHVLKDTIVSTAR